MLLVKKPQSYHAFSANTYIVASDGECAIIDPAVPYCEELISGKLKYIFLTHAHFDHMLDINSWASKTGAPVLVSEGDADKLSDGNLNCYTLFSGRNNGYYGKYQTVREGDTFALGSETLRVLELSGHTSGSIALLSEGMSFVGDTVFAGGGFGRWDLPTGDLNALKKSIGRICELDGDTVLYSGHGESTTVQKYIEEFKRQRFI
ncbi:MAG: MBL fold metallo-hydrolase [Clostridia bacterium]|nr:MBL fold metallo-hydrolase [Clostridia bacterium]